MHYQQSKRSHLSGSYNYASHIKGSTILNSEPTYLFRSATESSVEILNNSTRGIRENGASRIVDYFSMTLIYPNKIRKFREQSSKRNLPEISTIAEALGNMSLRSLRQPVAATVKGVGDFNNTIGVRLSYPEFEEERMAINSLVGNMLGYKSGANLNVGPGYPHVTVMAGSIPFARIKQISNRLPDIIQLGVAQNLDGAI